MIIDERLNCAQCTNSVRPDSNRGYRHSSERGYQCGRVRWGRAVTQWARTGNLISKAPLFCCLITRNTLLDRLQVGS